MKNLFLLVVLFLVAPNAAFGVWIHPDMKKAIKRVEDQEKSGTVSQGDRIVVDGKSRFTGYRPSMKQYDGALFQNFPSKKQASADDVIPEELDYTLISPPVVVEQQCGDCWAQGAAQAFQGVIGWLDKASRDISRQSIIDCSGYGSCNGGQISVGFFDEPKGAVYTSDYPYAGYNQKCKTSKLKYQEHARKTGFVRGQEGGAPTVQDYQRAMMETGPIEVCGASSALSGSDKDGFILSNRRGSVDHCWAMYGWVSGAKHGKTPGVYGIMVNSWGTDWGKDGIVYLRLAKDDVNITGSAVTEGAFIDYKDAPPPGPVVWKMTGTCDIEVKVEPGKISAEKVKASLKATGFAEVVK